MKYKTEKYLYRKKIKELEDRYGFSGLWHFTDYSNLKSIFNEGTLYSRKYCKEKDIRFKDGAESSVLDKAGDNVKTATRFYYRHATPTLYDNEGVKTKKFCNEVHIPIPVYLLFDSDIICDNRATYSNGNATTSEIGNDYNFFENMDWKTIFHSSWFYPEDRDYIIRLRQAELLIHSGVSLKYLKNIIFRTQSDYKQAVQDFGPDKRYLVQPNRFSQKDDKQYGSWLYYNYVEDYKIHKKNVGFTLDFWLMKPIQGDSLTWSAVNNKGKRLSIEQKNLIVIWLYDVDNKRTMAKEDFKRVIFNCPFSNIEVKNIKFFLNGCLVINIDL